MTQQPLTTVLRLAKFACWALLFLTLLASGRTAWAAPEAEWIWKPDVAKEEIAKKAECYFRRVFTMKAPEAAVVTIAADDAYELYINGKKVGSGTGTKKLLEYDVSPLLGVGQNVVAVKVVNQAGNTAALCARVLVKDKGANWVSYSTNKQWKTSPTSAALWNTTAFTDRNWQNAQVFGKLGETVPWDLAAEESEPEQLQKGDRFTIDSEFEVQRVMEGEHTGSIIAMTFNEFGQVVISREGGTLALLVDETAIKSRKRCDPIAMKSRIATACCVSMAKRT